MVDLIILEKVSSRLEHLCISSGIGSVFMEVFVYYLRLLLTFEVV